MREQLLFIEHYEPFIKSGYSIKRYCLEHGLDYTKFRKWRVSYEDSNNLPRTYTPRSGRHDNKSGFSPLIILPDDSSANNKQNSIDINATMKLPHGIEVDLHNISADALLHIIKGL